MTKAMPWPAPAAITILALYLLSLVLPMTSGGGGLDDSVLEQVALVLGFGLFAGLGALMVYRRPTHPMGWIFASIGLLVSFGQVGDTLATPHAMAGTQPPGWITWLAWVNTWYWYLMLAELIIAVPVLFPDGHLPSRRWRIPAGVIAATAVCVMSAMAERIEVQSQARVSDIAVVPEGAVVRRDVVTFSIGNPIGIAGMTIADENEVADLLLLGGFLGGSVMAVSAMVVRFRRSRGTIERQQLKWFFLAGAGLLILPVTDVIAIPAPVGNVVFAAVLIALSTSIALAILRYRLYEIDRIVSRTATYVVLTIVLAGLYAGVVLAAQAVLGPEDAPDVVVALATLLVAALFGPMRRRVQRVMDRRFARSRYDAARVVEGLGSRLRDQLDTHALMGALTDSVDATVRPAATWVWLPTPGTE
jgi:hypothetical protein